MKDKTFYIVGLLGVLTLCLIIGTISEFFVQPLNPPREWDAPADGWTFVGRTEGGTAIHKKYFKEHGVWLFATRPSRGEASISAVPLEILLRTEAGESYKEPKK